MFSLCSARILLCRFMSSLGDFQIHPLCLKGAPCSNKQNRQFNRCLELSKDSLISILCCLLKVSTGSSSFILIFSFFLSLSSPQQTTDKFSCSNSIRLQLVHFATHYFLCHTYFQSNLTELKSFGSPVAAVTNVTAAVMVLTAPRGKVPKDRSWKAAKVMMAKVDSFLDSLINFDKENIPESCLKAIQPYLKVSFFVSLQSLKSTLTAHSVQYLLLGKFN